MNPDDRKYTREHEWAKLERNQEVVIGLTQYAQDQLGDIVYLSLPSVGDSVEQNTKMGEVESVKSVSDIYCPVSGEVIAVNQELTDHPELLNQDPYGKGWIVRLRLADPGQIEQLLSAQEYEALLGEES